MKQKRNLLWLVFAVLLFAVQPSIQAAPKEDFTKVVLKNGLTLMYRVMKDQPMVSISAVMPIGSNFQKKRSMAHLTEHMLFRGSTEYSFDDILDVTSRQGGSFDGETYNSATMFKYVAPKVGFESAFKVFNNMLWNATLSESDMALEQKIIVHETAMRYPNEKEWYSLWRYLLGSNNDTVQSLHEISAQDLKDYYQAYYQPANATYIMAGDFDPEAVIAALEKVKNKYGSSDKKIADAIITDYDLPHQNITEEQNLYPYQYQVLMAYEFSGMTPADRMVLKVLGYLYGNSPPRIDYENNEYKEYYLVPHTQGNKDYVGLYYLEKNHPYTEASFNEVKANLLKFIREFKKVDVKAQRKELSLLIDLERAKSSKSADDAVAYQLQRITDPDNVTIDSLETLQKLTSEDLARVVDKYFSQPPTTVIVVKNADKGGK